MPLEEQAATALAAKYGTPITVAGGSAAFAFGYDANTVGMLVGVVVGLAGLVVTWYYKKKADTRHIEAQALEREEHKLRVQVLKKQLNDANII